VYLRNIYLQKLQRLIKIGSCSYVGIMTSL